MCISVVICLWFSNLLFPDKSYLRVKLKIHKNEVFHVLFFFDYQRFHRLVFSNTDIDSLQASKINLVEFRFNYSS
jgi:hypothetical protein